MPARRERTRAATAQLFNRSEIGASMLNHALSVAACGGRFANFFRFESLGA
jgi:hypothetical protein